MSYDSNIPIKMRDWIDTTKLNYSTLSKNPNSFKISRHNLMNLIHCNNHQLNNYYINWILLVNDHETLQIIENNINKCISKIIMYKCEYNIKLANLIDKYFSLDRRLGHNIYYIYTNPNCINALKKTKYDEYFKLDVKQLVYNSNEEALKILESNIDLLHDGCWMVMLEENSNKKYIAHLIKKYYDNMPMQAKYMATLNPYVVDLIKEKINNNDMEFIDPVYISSNENIISILENKPELIHYWALSDNINYKAIKLLENNLDKIKDYNRFLMNPTMIQLIEKNINMLDHWENISSYIYENDIRLVKIKNKWNNLSLNPLAMDILKHNQDKINYDAFSSNPNIFTYNYKKMKLNKKNINKAIIKEMYKPERIQKYLECNFNIDDYLN